MGKRGPAKGRHVKMNNNVKSEYVRPNYVDGIDEPRDVPEQNIRTEGEDIAEENPGDHQERRENSHDGSVGELLKRVEFRLGRRPERIFLSPENGDQVKLGLF